MSSRKIIYQHFLDGLWTAGDESALRGVAGRLTDEMGFEWFAYLGLGEEGPIILTSYDRQWRQHYFEHEYENVDPVVTAARVATGPFVWDGEAPELVRSTKERKFFAEAADFGIRYGVTLPIRGAFNRFAALTMAGGRSGRDCRNVLEQSGDLLQMAALYFHVRVDLTMRSNPAVRPALSQREIECLAWASRGKTMKEAASIIGLRPRTVAFHLENARVKLGATNITHAAVIAVRLRLFP